MDISSLFQFSQIEWVAISVLLLFFVVQLLYYTLIYRRPYVYEKKRKVNQIAIGSYPSVSVIVASKNEADELERNLPLMLEQDYPNFEVIVVNSSSTDNTDMVLKSIKQKYKNFYHTYVPKSSETVHERKLAVTLGIKAAKNDILLFTEAYCRPCSTYWIREMAQAFTDEKEIVLGYCKLQVEKKTLHRRFIKFDNLIQNLKLFSMALIGKPFMGIGRNLAYRKSFFWQQRGFSSVLNVDYGEDDLFINTVANKKNTAVVLSSESMTETAVVKSLSIWRAMKSEYLFTRQFYKNRSHCLLSWETFSKYAFWIALTAVVALGVIDLNYVLLGLAALLLIVRLSIQFIVVNKNARLFDAGRYYFSLPFFDLWQPLSNFRFRKKQQMRRV